MLDILHDQVSRACAAELAWAYDGIAVDCADERAEDQVAYVRRGIISTLFTEKFQPYLRVSDGIDERCPAGPNDQISVRIPKHQSMKERG